MQLIEARGTHSQIGQQLGEQCKETALKLRDQFRENWSRKEIAIVEAMAHSEKFFPYAHEFYYPYVEELAGYALATNIHIGEVLAWLCYDPPPRKGCTDLVLNQRVTSDGHVYMVHNEDYDVQEEDYAVMVRVEPQGSPSILAMTYGGIWFNGGVNSEGIGVAGNALSHTDSRVGIPGDFSFRKTLSARTIGEAMDYSTPSDRSFSYCNVICDDSGEMYSMEGSATDFAALHDSKFLVHTNHYLSPKMERYEAAFKTPTDRSPGSYSDSIVRYNRAVNLVEDSIFNRAWHRDCDGIEIADIRKIMSDHVNRPWSICRHPDETQPEHERSKTVFSEIIDVTKRSIRVCKGNPCEGEYVEHKL